jgi:hypothetical protein
VKPGGKKAAGGFGLAREAEKEPVGMRMQLLQDQAHHHRHTRIIIEAKMCESKVGGGRKRPKEMGRESRATEKQRW